MLIRTGLLAVSTLNDQTLDAITHTLGARVPNVRVTNVQAIGSQRHWIADTLMQWCDEEELDLVLTLGGTLPAPGPSVRETMPEAINDVIERPLPGLAEAMRSHAAAETRLAYLERCVAGIRGRTLLLALPQGTAGALLFLTGVIDLIEPVVAHLHELPHALIAEDELTLVADEEIEPAADEPQNSGLNAADFAAFRRRRGK
ncbi:MAG: hypothetical protein KDD92_00590 [Caldilineaceae bacterium]|nr:hypothetical protein [Caldilineaceae bacterium]